MKTFKIRLRTMIITGLVSVTTVTSCGEVDTKSEKKEEEKTEISDAASQKAELIKRGEYLVTIAGCGDCHSPKIFDENGVPREDPERRFSGHPSDLTIANYDKETTKNWVLMNYHNTACVGPWGVSYSANISSDPSGIGSWTEAQFINAMRKGKYKGSDEGRDLLPPMPWPSYSKMEYDDLKAIFTFLQSTKPVSNVVPAPIFSEH